MKVGHQMELFGKARRALMAPHSAGESQAIGSAIIYVCRALRELDVTDIEDAEISDRLARLDALINLHPEDTAPVRAEKLTIEQRGDLRDCVDALANHFHLQYFGSPRKS